MASRAQKQQLFGGLARVGKAFSSPVRLELLDLLAQAPHTVEALAILTEQSVANASHHLKVLRQAQLVVGEKRGTEVWCRLAGDDVGQLWLGLRDVGSRRLAEVSRAAEDLMDGEPVGLDELRRRLEAGEVVLVDVRPAAEFYAGHLPGAVSIPIDELEARLDELPRGLETVAYCRGPLCTFAAEAVAVLRDHGFPADRFAHGVPEWRSAGLPVEVA